MEFLHGKIPLLSLGLLPSISRIFPQKNPIGRGSLLYVKHCNQFCFGILIYLNPIMHWQVRFIEKCIVYSACTINNAFLLKMQIYIFFLPFNPTIPTRSLLFFLIFVSSQVCFQRCSQVLDVVPKYVL